MEVSLMCNQQLNYELVIDDTNEQQKCFMTESYSSNFSIEIRSKSRLRKLMDILDDDIIIYLISVQLKAYRFSIHLLYHYMSILHHFVLSVIF